MTDTVKNIQIKALPILQKYGILKAAVFGSVARGEAGPESDIDLLVDFPRGKTLFDLIRLRRDLMEIFGTSVDVVTYRSLHHLIKDRVLNEQIQIL